MTDVACLRLAEYNCLIMTFVPLGSQCRQKAVWGSWFGTTNSRGS